MLPQHEGCGREAQIRGRDARRASLCGVPVRGDIRPAPTGLLYLRQRGAGGAMCLCRPACLQPLRGAPEGVSVLAASRGQGAPAVRRRPLRETADESDRHTLFGMMGNARLTAHSWAGVRLPLLGWPASLRGRCRLGDTLSIDAPPRKVVHSFTSSRKTAAPREIAIRPTLHAVTSVRRGINGETGLVGRSSCLRTPARVGGCMNRSPVAGRLLA